MLKKHADLIDNSFKGCSELGKNIPVIKIGYGSKNILIWSQMHGNESTTTKALFDFFNFLTQKESFQDEIRDFLKNYTLYTIPILNPDGASRYTRENSNKIDLNRDAQDLSQKESIFLRKVFDEIKPQLCLNLHGQRSLFGLKTGSPAMLSFLSPAVDLNRTISPSRLEAMEYIIRINHSLQQHIPGQIGRYDDSFNKACVGDTFQMEGVTTILIEAGHHGQDYMREGTRKVIFYSFLALFELSKTSSVSVNYEDYFLIPANKKNFKDVILRNISVDNSKKLMDLSIQYSEKLDKNKIRFEPILDYIGDLNEFFGHIDIDVDGACLLVNSRKDYKAGDRISTIVNEIDSSLIYF